MCLKLSNINAFTHDIYVSVTVTSIKWITVSVIKNSLLKKEKRKHWHNA